MLSYLFNSNKRLFELSVSWLYFKVKAFHLLIPADKKRAAQLLIETALILLYIYRFTSTLAIFS